MTISIAEKNHWQERIFSKIQRKIERLIASQSETHRALEEEAKQKAAERLGLVEYLKRKEELAEQLKTLEGEKEALLAKTVAKVCPDHRGEYGRERAIQSALDKCEQQCTQELYREHELGREILRLRDEQENLLDTVWLASSPRQVKELWTKVSELLSDSPTTLEAEALALEPVAEQF